MDRSFALSACPIITSSEGGDYDLDIGGGFTLKFDFPKAFASADEELTQDLQVVRFD